MNVTSTRITDTPAYPTTRSSRKRRRPTTTASKPLRNMSSRHRQRHDTTLVEFMTTATVTEDEEDGDESVFEIYYECDESKGLKEDTDQDLAVVQNAALLALRPPKKSRRRMSVSSSGVSNTNKRQRFKKPKDFDVAYSSDVNELSEELDFLEAFVDAEDFDVSHAISESLKTAKREKDRSSTDSSLPIVPLLLEESMGSHNTAQEFQDADVDVEHRLFRDFHCCGMVLRDMHELLHHYEECHVQLAESVSEDQDDDEQPSNLHSFLPTHLLHVEDHEDHEEEEEEDEEQEEDSDLEDLHNGPPLDALMDELEFHLSASPNASRLTVNGKTVYSNEGKIEEGDVDENSNIMRSPMAYTRSRSVPNSPSISYSEMPLSAFDDSVVIDYHECEDEEYISPLPEFPLIRRIGDVEDDLGMRVLELIQEEMKQDVKGVKLMADDLIVADTNCDESRFTKKRLLHDFSEDEIDVVGSESLVAEKCELPLPPLNLMHLTPLDLKGFATFGAPSLYDLDEVARQSNEYKPYRCTHPGCDKAYKNPNGLKYHNLHGHCGEDENEAEFAARLLKPYLCSIASCYKRYKNLNGLKYHMEKSHGFSKTDANQIATAIVKKTNSDYGIHARSVPSTVLLAAMKEKQERERSQKDTSCSSSSSALKYVQPNSLSFSPMAPAKMGNDTLAAFAAAFMANTVPGGAQMNSSLATKAPVPLAPKVYNPASVTNALSNPAAPTLSKTAATSVAGAGIPPVNPLLSIQQQAFRSLLLSSAAAAAKASATAAASSTPPRGQMPPANLLSNPAYLQALAALLFKQQNAKPAVAGAAKPHPNDTTKM